MYALRRILRAIARRFYRSPDVVIGGTIAPYLLRWHVWPRNRFVNLYLHKFFRSDDDRALHDHPWINASILLRGAYREHLPGGTSVVRTAPAIVLRLPSSAHRIARVAGEWIPVSVGHGTIEVQFVDEPMHPRRPFAVTLFLTGPKVREWGFLCPDGWTHWKVFTSGHNALTGRSRGCAKEN